MENALEAQILMDACAVPSDDNLGRAAALANEMVQLEAELAALEAQMEEKGQRLDHIAKVALPTLMKEIGLKEFKLTDDSFVTTKTVYTGHISDENLGGAVKWLRDNKFGDLVKNQFKISFGMSEDKRSIAFAKRLEKAGYSYEQKQGVHPSTLNAFIREQTEAGKPVSDLLSPYIQDVAQVKRPKVKVKKEKTSE